MDYMRKAAAAALTLSLAAVAVLPAAAAAPKIPVEAFATLPVVEQVALSPNGLKAALLVNNEGTTTIMVQELGTPDGKKTFIMSTDNKQYSFNWFAWVGDNRLLVSTLFPSKRRENSTNAVGGVDTYETRLLSAAADGSQVINLMKPNSFKGEMQAQFQDDVIDFHPDNGKHVLISLADQEDTWDPVVYSLDVEAGTRSHVFGPRRNFSDWMVDRNHQVRLGVLRQGANMEIHACDPDGRNWRKLWSFQALDTDIVTPVGFDKDPNLLYVLANHNGNRALFHVDLRDPQLKRTLKLEGKDYDLGGDLTYSKKTGEVIGLMGSSVQGRSAANFWDKDRKELMEFIDQALPERYNHIVSTSADENRYVLHSSNGRISGEFYLGDDRANKLGLLAVNYPRLAARDMASKEEFTIKARDGLALPAYLTLPQDSTGKNLPMVLLVHGGPHSHDDDSFDTWAQFMVNRGYAVLQVNFRGSSGMGGDFMAAGLRRWGQEMQDDLTDAVHWAIERGTADSKRVCIVGGSYGGYAALMGVAKTPALYRCAVSFAGVSDLVELVHDAGYYGRGYTEVVEKQIGSLATDSERLRANSPVNLARQIKSPVLLVHGTLDRSVPYDQGTAMDAALTAAGVPHRFIKQDLGDHHLSIYQHRLQFLNELESFLTQNLGVAR
jgi:dipeptidyl aminopeptidase/acylaminoacyl peptidase